MMSIIITAVAFACMLSGSLLGVFIRKQLPPHHRSEASRDILKAAVGLIGTLVALVLGLLVSSAKSRFDSMDAGIIQAGAECILLDRDLAHYGPEAKPSRDRLRQVIASATESIWPTNASHSRDLKSLESSARMEDVERMLRELTPKTESQRAIHAQALQVTADISQTRWLLLAQSQYSVPTLFLVILILWLMVLYTGLGLLAPGHATAVLSLCVSAVSVAGAVFLVLELSDPLDGFVKISGAPLVKALSIMGQ